RSATTFSCIALFEKYAHRRSSNAPMPCDNKPCHASFGQQCFLLFCILLTAAGIAGADPTDPPRVQALSSSVSITLHGHLDELAWPDAPVIKILQQSPKPREPKPYRN